MEVRISRWVLLFGVVLSGCERTEDRPAIIVGDSLGVEIIEVDLRQIESMRQLNPSPEWIVGEGAESEELVLHQVVDADLSEDGVVWIANQGSQEIIGVDVSSGSVVRLGGDGDGPDEFRGLSRVWSTAPERVGAFDQTHQRYVELSAAGALLREVSFPRIWETPGSRALHRVPDQEEGEIFYLAVITGLPSGPVDGPHRGRGPLVRIDTPADTLTWIRGTTTFVGEWLAGPVLFGAATHLAEGPEGIWVGDSERPEVVLWSDGRDPVSIVRWVPRQGTQLTEERKRQFWERLESAASEEEREMIPQMREEFRFADAIPEFGSVLVDEHGSLWLGPFEDPEFELLEQPVPERDWLVIHVVEQEASRVRVPVGFRPLRVGSGFALGVHRDEFGVETVRLHRLPEEEGTEAVDEERAR
jgi:hypothetical protein